MRVWDEINPADLCRNHLLGEHRELHGLRSVLQKIEEGESVGYAHHPEVERWSDFIPALRSRHDAIAEEMVLREYNHKTPMDPGEPRDDEYPDPFDDQVSVLLEKECECQI